MNEWRKVPNRIDEAVNTKVIKELDGFKLEYDPKKIDKNKLLTIIGELEA